MGRGNNRSKAGTLKYRIETDPGLNTKKLRLKKVYCGGGINLRDAHTGTTLE